MEAAGVVDAVEEVFDGAARLSPAARRFMAGEMDDEEAVRLGFKRPDADGDAVD